MSYPPEVSASEKRCTVTGRMKGSVYSLVIKELPSGEVVIYPHGIDGDAVLLAIGSNSARPVAIRPRDHTPAPMSSNPGAPATAGAVLLGATWGRSQLIAAVAGIERVDSLRAPAVGSVKVPASFL